MAEPRKHMNFADVKARRGKLTRQEEIKQKKDGIDVLPDLYRYASLGFAAIPEEEFERFKWYGFYRQKPKNSGFFMLRTKIPGGRLNSAQARGHADDSAGMRRGVVQKVDLNKGVFNVFGQPVSFDPRRVRVVGADGKQTTIYALRQGANVRFTLDPADPLRKRAAVIFVN